MKINDITYVTPKKFWKEEILGIDVFTGALEYENNKEKYDAKVCLCLLHRARSVLATRPARLSAHAHAP